MRSAERRLIALENTIRSYDWGSARDIPELLGIEPTGEPAAEMWIGAHPGSPSRAARADGAAPADGAAAGRTLRELIAADPIAMLGADAAQRFSSELPYLLKLLAASRPLSLQTHPTLEQAQAGYAAEDADGVPLDDPRRSYLDRNHKPEVLCALAPFEALCGFRPIADSALFLQAAAAAGASPLAAVAQRLVAEGGLRDVVTWLLTLPAADQAALAASAGAACDALRQQPVRWLDDADLIARMAALHPGDAGVVLAMLLNHVRLAPGEAIFLAAGQIHSYIRGFGVELMASSDNVLRAGFTSKHINIPELLRTVVFDAREPVLLVPQRDGAGELCFPSPAPDFALRRLDLAEGAQAVLERIAPSLVLCVAGRAVLRVDGEELALGPGGSAFVAAGSDLRICGQGASGAGGPATVFRATVGASETGPGGGA